MDKSDNPVNVVELLEIMDNDEELLKECLTDFLNDYPEMLNQIRSAIVSGNGEDLEVTAHAMKGSLKYLAAFTAADFAYRLESMGKAGTAGGAEAAFDDLEKECEKIRFFLNGYLA